jgi:hypothetical protein
MVDFPGLAGVNLGWLGLGISALGILAMPILWIVSILSTLLFPVWIVVAIINPALPTSSSSGE